MSDHPSGDEDSNSKKPDETSLFTCAATLILYFVQVVPAALFFSVYPVLYGLRGFSENDLTFLSIGYIPWCLKFVFGFLFECLWRPPRIFIALLQFLISGITLSLFWVPIENVKLTAVLYCVYTLIVVSHDVVIDGQLIMVFANHGALLNLLQRFAYYTTTVVLCFTTVSEFNQTIFLVSAILCFVTIPLLWVYKWKSLPLVGFHGVLKDLLKVGWVVPICFIYFLVECWLGMMAPYFAADLVSDDQKAGFVVGARSIGELVGVAFGQYVFFKLKYKNCIISAFIIETLSIIFVIFLVPGSSYPLVLTLFLLGGLSGTFSDSIMQCFKVDGAGLTQCPTLVYSVFESFYESAVSIGGAVWPQAKKPLSWTGFWEIDMVVCAVLTVVAGLSFYLVPVLKRQECLNMTPTLHLEELWGGCRGKEQTAVRAPLSAEQSESESECGEV